MKIESIRLSVLDVPGQNSLFSLAQTRECDRFYWRQRPTGAAEAEIHVLHVRTSDGVEGVRGVGDARYSTLRSSELEQMQHLAVGENALDRDRLYERIHYATRFAFLKPGWFGALDQCLWDIAGKPVCDLLGHRRTQVEAYFNIRNYDRGTSLADADIAIQSGFKAVKDHYAQPSSRNAEWLRSLRAHVGPDIDLMHDASGCQYTEEEALHIGKVLTEPYFTGSRSQYQIVTYGRFNSSAANWKFPSWPWNL